MGEKLQGGTGRPAHSWSEKLRLAEAYRGMRSTVIAGISDRFGEAIDTPGENGFDTGSAVNFANGGYQVSYTKVPALVRSRIGDKVLMCLVSLPRDCPPGDDRGRVYTTTNLRTEESWSMPDAQLVAAAPDST